jgi:hypothetical protein
MGAVKKVQDTHEYKVAMAASDKIVAAIHEGIKSAAGRIEALIKQESMLQGADITLSKTPEEKTAVKNAMTEYRSLAEVVSQMRRTPDEYIKANVSMKAARMDPAKQPRERGLNQIDGNIIRCKNRALHATDDMRQVWEARVVLAKETRKALRALHRSVVTDFERRLKDPVKSKPMERN